MLTWCLSSVYMRLSGVSVRTALFLDISVSCGQLLVQWSLDMAIHQQGVPSRHIKLSHISLVFRAFFRSCPPLAGAEVLAPSSPPADQTPDLHQIRMPYLITSKYAGFTCFVCGFTILLVVSAPAGARSSTGPVFHKQPCHHRGKYGRTRAVMG